MDETTIHDLQPTMREVLERPKAPIDLTKQIKEEVQRVIDVNGDPGVWA